MGCLFPPGQDDVMLSDIAIPGSHDSATAELADSILMLDPAQSGSSCALSSDLLSIDPSIVQNWAQAQDTSIEDQLNLGIRYFDIRTAWMGSVNDGNEWRIVHSMFGTQSLSATLAPIVSFAQQYPDEVIMVDLSHVCYDNGASDKDSDGQYTPDAFAAQHALADELIDGGSGLCSVAYDPTNAPDGNPASETIAGVRSFPGQNVVLMMDNGTTNATLTRLANPGGSPCVPVLDGTPSEQATNGVSASVTYAWPNQVAPYWHAVPLCAGPSPTFEQANIQLQAYPLSASPSLGSQRGGKGFYQSQILYSLAGGDESYPDTLCTIDEGGSLLQWEQNFWQGGAQVLRNDILAAWGTATNIVVSDGVENNDYVATVVGLNSGSHPTTMTFACTDSTVNYQVPPGVPSFTASVAGSQGAFPLANSAQGGRGAWLSGQMTVPGDDQTWQVQVGCQSNWPDGGWSGSANGGGGGSSSIWASDGTPRQGATPLMIAAGGGGADYALPEFNNDGGGDGGMANGNGGGGGDDAGGGASSTSGGSGSGGAGYTGQAGGQYFGGGAGSGGDYWGGGGGGGNYGGGGGSSSNFGNNGGGGGGSSYYAQNLFDLQSFEHNGDGDGFIMLTPDMPPPAVTTGSAGSITATSAALDATVTPYSNTTDVYFLVSQNQYMDDAVTVDAGEDLAASISPRSVSATLNNLTPGVMYFYQIVADNGISPPQAGQVQSVVTPSPPLATTGPYPIDSGTEVIFSGTVNPMNVLTNVTVAYGTDPQLVGATVVTAFESPIAPGSFGDLAISATATGLTPSTKYYYQVIAQNANGTTEGEILSFTSQGVGLLAYPAEDLTETGATLQGLVSTPGWTVEVSFNYSTQPQMTNPITVATQPNVIEGYWPNGQQVSAQVSGLSLGTTYYYQLVGTTSSGVFAGDVLNFTTLGDDDVSAAKKRQFPVGHCVVVPRHIPRTGSTLLMRKPCRTNAGHRVTVNTKAVQPTGAGDLRQFSLQHSRHEIRLRTSQARLKMRVTWSAKPSQKFKGYKQNKIYNIG